MGFQVYGAMTCPMNYPRIEILHGQDQIRQICSAMALCSPVGCSEASS